MFELASEAEALPALEADIDRIDAALAASADLRSLISSPLYTRDDQARAVAALASAIGLSEMMANTLQLMAAKRRLFVLPRLMAELRDRIAEAKGEVTAEVTAARALTEEQSNRLAETLRARIGKTVKLNVAVDESLIGGLVVKVGSKMIDTSVRSRLAALQNVMKEVG